MAAYGTQTLEQILAQIDEDNSFINEYAKKVGSQEIIEVLEKRPGCFILLKDEYKTNEVCKFAVKQGGYALYRRIPLGKRTTEVKLALIEKRPEMIEVFSKDELDYEVVKYVYIYAPFILEDFTDKKIQSKINKYIAMFQKEGIKQMIYESEGDE